MKTEHTKELIKDLQIRLGLTYEGFRNKHHVFSKQYPKQDKISHQYFFEDECFTCKKPRLNRKNSPSKNCIGCSNKIASTAGRPLGRSSKKTLREKAIMDQLYQMAEENQRLLALQKNNSIFRVTPIRLR